MKEYIKRFAIIACSIMVAISMLNPIVHAEETDDENTDITSVSMLNYLTVLNQEINSERNNKLYMEEAYSYLIANTYPNAIDDRTQRQLNHMLDTIEEYRMLTVKRERLQYIFEQNQAQALRDAVPNPMALVSTAVSLDWKRMIASIVYMAVDSKASYDSSMASAEMKYLQDGWELDDEAANALHESRKQMFNYLNDIVRIHDISGDLTLGESEVSEFVEWKNNTNITGRIDWLEKHEDTYKMFGGYWLLLAESYYNNEQYEKCVSRIDKYIDLQKNARIFRKDYDLSRVLPLAIFSVQNSKMSNEKKEEKIRNYVELLKDNIKTSDWSLRYFAAQSYIYLSTLSNSNRDLRTAYELVIDNINYLVPEQKKLNENYLEPVKEEEKPADATKEQKAEIDKYNKLLKENRKKELPPISQPLLFNLDLLTGLSEKLNITESDKIKLEKILYGNDKDEILFLNTILDNAFRTNEEVEEENYSFEFEKKKITVSSNAVSSNSSISVTVNSGGEITEYTDWIISEVKRGKDSNIENFKAIYKSESAKNMRIKDGDTIQIKIMIQDNERANPVIASFKAKEVKKFFFLKDIVFERND